MAESPIASATITFGGKPVVSPYWLLQESERLGLPTDVWLHRSNSFLLPRGREPGRGWLLMLKKDLDDLSLNVWTHTLTFKVAKTTISVSKLAIVRAQAINAGQTVDDNAVFMVEVVDRREVAKFSALNASYNIPSPDPSTPMYTLQSWTTVLANIWDNNLDSILGALDSSDASFPGGYPVNYNFQGMRAWDAFHSILKDSDHLFIYTRAGVAKIVRAGSAPTTVATALTGAKNKTRKNSHDVVSDICRFPETVRVFFPNQDYAFQLSSEVMDKTFNDYWKSRTATSIDKATSDILSGVTTLAGTVAVVWDSHPLTYDHLGNADSGALSTQVSRATTRATNYLNAIKNSDKWFYNEYSGLVDVTPDVNLSAVWWGDFGDGIVTETILSPRNVTVKVTDGKLTHFLDALDYQAEEFPGPADLSRNHFPVERFAVVELQDDLIANGSAAAYVMYRSSVTQWQRAPYKELTVYEIRGKGPYPKGTGTGSMTTDPGLRLYLVMFAPQANRWIMVDTFQDEGLVRFELYEDREYADDISEARRVVFNTPDYELADPPVVMNVTAPFSKWVGKTGYRGWAIRMADRPIIPGGTPSDPDDWLWEIVYLEAPARWLSGVLHADAEMDTPVPGINRAEVYNYPSDRKFWGAAPNHKEQEGETFYIYDKFDLLKNAKENYAFIAVYDEKDDRYYVTHCSHRAQFTRFTLTEAMNPAGTDTTADENGYWGTDRWGQEDPGSPSIVVRDNDNRFQRAPSGAKGFGVYYFNTSTPHYRVIACEQYADFIEFVATSDASPLGGTANITVESWWGSNPWATIEPVATEVHTSVTFAPHLVTGTRGVAVYDYANDRYEVISLRDQIFYGKAQSNWSENMGDPKVSVKYVTDRTGATEVGLAFDVYLPRIAEKDPNVRTGDVIAYTMDYLGDFICLTPYLDDKIKTIKLWFDSTANIPPGWQECDGTNGTPDLRGRFVVGYDSQGTPPTHSDSAYGTLGAIGGYKKHSHKYTPCAFSNVETASGFGTIQSWVSNPDSVGEYTTADATTPDGDKNVDHRPPWLAAVFIMRVD